MESKNFKSGRNVKDISELYSIAIARGSVFIKHKGIKPARAILNYPAWILHKMILDGSIKISIKK